MSDQLGVILDFLMRPGVDYNLQKQKYWGVLFHKKPNNTLSAIVASAYFVVEMENVEVDVKGEFFYYRENKWGESPYPRSAQDILQVFNTPRFGSISPPLPNLLNFIGRIREDVRKRSRIVIASNNYKKDLIILKFSKEPDGVIRARNPKVQKPFIPTNPNFSPDFAERNHFYSCRIVREEAEAILVEVVEIYGLARLGLKYSPQGYVPNHEITNNLLDISPEFIFPIYQVSPKDFFLSPTHLDCSMFYDLLRVFHIIQTKIVDISLYEDTNVPIIMKNRKESASDPQINVMMATLNQSFGAQRR